MNIEKIIGCNFHKMSRAADMMCLGIGNRCYRKSRNGRFTMFFSG
jgi:hypothetical protein